MVINKCFKSPSSNRRHGFTERGPLIINILPQGGSMTERKIALHSRSLSKLVRPISRTTVSPSPFPSLPLSKRNIQNDDFGGKLRQVHRGRTDSPLELNQCWCCPTESTAFLPRTAARARKPFTNSGIICTCRKPTHAQSSEALHSQRVAHNVFKLAAPMASVLLTTGHAHCLQFSRGLGSAD